MNILRDVYKKMIFNIPTAPPEIGGILGEIQGTITHIYIDRCNICKDRAVYVPDVNLLNDIIVEWEKRKINFIGIFHSHIKDNEQLSSGDITYIEYIMKVLPNKKEYLLFPIVIPRKKIVFYKVTKTMSINIEKIDIV